MNTNNSIANSIRVFSLFSAIWGLLSLLSFFTGIFPLFTGGMGILFAVMSYRKGSPLPTASRFGVYLSVIGVLLGLLILAYAYYNVFLPMMSDPEYYNAMNQYYINNFGVSLDELFGDYTGAGF